MASDEYMTASELITELGWLHPDCPVEFEPISMAWLGTSGPMRMRNGKEGRVTIYDKEGSQHEPGIHGPGGDPKDCRAVIFIFEDRSNE